MIQRLLQVLFLTAAFHATASAQVLFDAPDTVCVNQPFTVQNHAVEGGNTYFWSFCSGYLNATPTAVNQGVGFGLNVPTAIDLVEDGGNFYAFVANGATGTLTRLDFGTSLANIPAATDLGDLGGAFPAEPTSVAVVQDGGNWHLFATGGNTVGASTMARLDFGSSLTNTPTAINFGNPGTALQVPRGLFITNTSAGFQGFLVNFNNSELVKITFGASLGNAPSFQSLGNPPATTTGVPVLSGPSDIAAAQTPDGNWHLLITNILGNSFVQLDFDATFTIPAWVHDLGNMGGLNSPSALTLTRDCGMDYAFITNAVSNEVVRVDIADLYNTGGYTAQNLGNVGGAFFQPADLTHIQREGNNLYGYVINAANNSLSRLDYSGCTNASLPSSTDADPGPITYDAPGLYTIYFVVNEGTPGAAIECQQVRVLPIPNIFLSVDTTICQGDTINLVAYALNSDTTRWMPNINITDTIGISTYVYPEYSLEYFAQIHFPFGCVVDTSIQVTVNKNKADAGPDRMLADGASAVLGGPATTQGSQYTYVWSPASYLDNAYVANPRANPATTLTYYLEVTSTEGCYDIDTVTLFVTCNDLNLPNAFAPEGRNGSNRFGLMNRQIVQLNYFRIFDRWGREVFSTTDVHREWDGRFNGELVQPGVYVWEADGFCRTNQRFTKTGNVTVLR